jgi:elongator complex protein 6
MKRVSFVDGLGELCLPKHQKQMGLISKEKPGVISSPSLVSALDSIRNSIRALGTAAAGGKTLLIVDQLDLLLATSGDDIGPVQVENALLALRQVSLDFSEAEDTLNYW